MTGLIVSVIVSVAKPRAFSWETTRSINAINCDDVSSPNSLNDRDNSDRRNLPTIQDEEKEIQDDVTAEEEPAKLKGAFKIACIASFLLTLIMDFLVPIPMFLSHYVFSQGFFTAWIVITFLWVFCSTAISVILPIVEAAEFFKSLSSKIFGRKQQLREG